MASEQVPSEQGPDFIADVVMNMAHKIDADKVVFYRSPAWPGNALNELSTLYERALKRWRDQQTPDQERTDGK